MKDMNKQEKKQLNNMKIMVQAFGEIVQVVLEEGSVCGHFDLLEKRYNKILDIVQGVEESLK